MAPASGEAFAEHVDLAARRRTERSARRDEDDARHLSRETRTRAQEQRRTERDSVASDAVYQDRRAEDRDHREEERAEAASLDGLCTADVAAAPGPQAGPGGTFPDGDPVADEARSTPSTGPGGPATGSGDGSGTIHDAAGTGGAGPGREAPAGAPGAGAGSASPASGGDLAAGVPALTPVQAGTPAPAGAAIAMQAARAGGDLPQEAPAQPAQPAHDGGLRSDPLAGGAPEQAAVVQGADPRGGGSGGGDAPARTPADGARQAAGVSTAPGVDPGAGFDTRIAEAGGRDVRPPEVRPGAPGAPPQAPSDGLAARALRPEQAAQVLKQVRLNLAGGGREATLHLQPAWLGRVSIRVAVRDGRARAEVRAERPEALQALERHLPELRAALAARGFEERGLELDLGLSGEARQTPGDRPLPWSDRSGRVARLAVPAELAGPVPSTDPLRSPDATRVDGGVDTYA